MKKVAVIMGSDSDLPVVEKAIDTLKEYCVPYEVHVYSAHRTPEQVKDFVSCAKDNGFGVIIAAAGMAAHLAGAVAVVIHLGVTERNGKCAEHLHIQNVILFHVPSAPFCIVLPRPLRGYSY